MLNVNKPFLKWFPKKKKIPVVLVHHNEELIGFSVDRFLGIHDVVVKPLGDHIQKIPNVGGTTILGEGYPVVILDPIDLIKNVKLNNYSTAKTESKRNDTLKSKQEILIVDDSLTTRMMEKTILESAGYSVDMAVSGEEALIKIMSGEIEYTLFIVDVQMPGINGFELTSRLKSQEEYSEIPVIIVSSLSTPDMKQQGIDSGAQAYIVKGEFDQNILLETINSLI